MDQPHGDKSYYPPMQLMQDGQVNIIAVFGYIMNQISAKAAKDALMAEFAQMEDLNVYEPVHASSLTPQQQRRGALRAITIVKEKRCDRRLKGRTVADGRGQKGLFEKSRTVSPTVATNALMLTVMIDAHERRDFATADIAGAYLKAKMDDFVIMHEVYWTSSRHTVQDEPKI